VWRKSGATRRSAVSKLSLTAREREGRRDEGAEPPPNFGVARRRATPRPHLGCSAVGPDRVPVVGGTDHAAFGYCAPELAAERAVAESDQAAGRVPSQTRKPTSAPTIVAATAPLAARPARQIRLAFASLMPWARRTCRSPVVICARAKKAPNA